jgi:4a-hydroxytetrahydrobiopterin dehydratase
MTKPDILSSEEVDHAIEALRWERNGDELGLSVTFPTFAQALGFVTAVGALAEANDHHPDIDLRYRTVALRVSTHEAGGLTHRDVTLARQVDGLL